MIAKYVQIFKIFKKLQNWKNLVSILVNIQALLVELWKKKPAPGLSSIQYIFMIFVFKLLLTALMKFFYCACA